MLIPCPHCGPRDSAEFTYQGDANRSRPAAASTDTGTWNSYVYNRQNPAGPHREYWQHAGGCRAHLVVLRNTLTHEISEVAFARAALNEPQPPAKIQQRKKAPARGNA